MSPVTETTIMKLIDNPIVSKACYTWRYSSSRLCDQENLSTHTYEVEMIGLMLMDKISSLSPEEVFNRETFLMKALFHDVDETILGDTPRPLKYASNGIHHEINVVADRVANTLLTGTFYEGEQIYKDYYDTAKSGKEGILVKIADMLSVVKKARLEVEYLGNLTMLTVYDNLVGYLSDLDRPETYQVFDTEDARRFLLDMFRDLQDYVSSILKKYETVRRL